MELISGRAQQEYAALVRAADGLVIGLDFDGTLAPIVDDPDQAHIHPDAGPVLIELADRVHAVAVVTGRPARKVLALGGLDQTGDAIGERGRVLHLFGQYGNERWTSTDRRVIAPLPPQGLSSLIAELPRLLERAAAVDAWVEEKGLALAVHTRRMPDPEAAFERLLPILTSAAHAHGLQVEPGRRVIEMRAPGMDKGRVVRELARDLAAGAFVFVGDDLGDVEAFEAVRELAMPTFLVCSGSTEVTALMDLADAVVPGPDGVLRFLRELTQDIDSARL